MGAVGAGRPAVSRTKGVQTGGVDQGGLPAVVRHGQLRIGLPQNPRGARPLWCEAQNIQLRHADGVLV
ncbi:hypothetical protein D3C85_1571580 [compost metagenome]